MCQFHSNSWPGQRVPNALWTKARRSLRNRLWSLRASVGIALARFMRPSRRLGGALFNVLRGPAQMPFRRQQILREDLLILSQQLAQLDLGLRCFRVAFDEGE